MAKTKIVLDADVIIHFAKGGYLSVLPSFLPGYDFIVLDTVYKEICGDTKRQLDNQLHHLKNIAFQRFEPKGEMMREYAQLIRTKGKGERVLVLLFVNSSMMWLVVVIWQIS